MQNSWSPSIILDETVEHFPEGGEGLSLPGPDPDEVDMAANGLVLHLAMALIDVVLLVAAIEVRDLGVIIFATLAFDRRASLQRQLSWTSIYVFCFRPKRNVEYNNAKPMILIVTSFPLTYVPQISTLITALWK